MGKAEDEVRKLAKSGLDAKATKEQIAALAAATTKLEKECKESQAAAEKQAEDRRKADEAAAALLTDAAGKVSDAATAAADAAAKSLEVASLAHDRVDAEGVSRRVIVWFVVFVLFIPVGAVLAVGSLRGSDLVGSGTSRLLVVPTIERDRSEVQGAAESTTRWTITGQVLYKNELAPDVAVMAILLDDRENQSYTRGATNADGRFELVISKTHEKEWKATDRKITVRAIYDAPGPWYGRRVHEEAEVVIERRTDASDLQHWSRESAELLWLALTLFVVCLIYVLFQRSNDRELDKGKYYSSVILAIAFTVLMVSFIGVGILGFGSKKTTTDVYSLGFADIYYGTYVEGTPGEWIFSLTSPPEVEAVVRAPRAEDRAESERLPDPPAREGDDDGVDTPPAEPVAGTKTEDEPDDVEPTRTGLPLSKGFGAPLWLLLLSTVGAGLFTIQLVIDNLRTPTDFSKPGQVRERLALLIKHQFYVLFAPMTSIFVYQLLVAAGGASETITVGFTALASGIAMSGVLEKAWGMLVPILKTTDDPKTG